MCLRRVWRERKEGREVRQRTRRGVREKGRGAQGGKEGREMKNLGTSLRWKALCTLFLSQSHLQESWASSFVYKGRKRGDLWWEMWLITTSWQPGNGNNLILMVSFPYHTHRLFYNGLGMRSVRDIQPELTWFVQRTTPCPSQPGPSSAPPVKDGFIQ